jgi:hypothetical protein
VFCLDEQRLVAALMLLVASCEQVVLECEGEPALLVLSNVAESLRDMAATEIQGRVPPRI